MQQKFEKVIKKSAMKGEKKLFLKVYSNPLGTLQPITEAKKGPTWG